MPKKRPRFPAYATLIGKDTEICGGIRFMGGLHVDGKVTGDVIGLSDEGCAVSVGQSGVIAGNVDVAFVVIDGSITGDVRAVHKAELASGAKIQGAVCYGALKMAEGAEVNGKLSCVDRDEASRPPQAEGGQDEAESEGSGPSAENHTGGERESLP
jgi:cytoskeletal protein CcmA (bactofilin family)